MQYARVLPSQASRATCPSRVARLAGVLGVGSCLARAMHPRWWRLTGLGLQVRPTHESSAVPQGFPRMCPAAGQCGHHGATASGRDRMPRSRCMSGHDRVDDEERGSPRRRRRLPDRSTTDPQLAGAPFVGGLDPAIRAVALKRIMRLEERLRRGQDEDVHPLQAQPWHASCSGATGRLRGPRSVENSLSERQKPKSCRQGHGASTRFFRGEGECRHRDHRWRHSRSGHPGIASTSGLSPHGRTADQESKTCDLTRRCSWAHMRQRRLAD